MAIYKGDKKNILFFRASFKLKGALDKCVEEQGQSFVPAGTTPNRSNVVRSILTDYLREQNYEPE